MASTHRQHLRRSRNNSGGCGCAAASVSTPLVLLRALLSLPSHLATVSWRVSNWGEGVCVGGGVTDASYVAQLRLAVQCG